MCNDKSVQGDGDGGVQVIENHMLTKSHPTVPDGAVDDYGIDLSKPILDQGWLHCMDVQLLSSC